MYETIYHVDIAAELIGCQQKKIITEWAKGTIDLIIDFGSPEGCYRDREAYNATITAPVTKEYFTVDFYDCKPHDYGYCGIYPLELLQNEIEEKAHKNAELITLHTCLYGFWILPYSEFARANIQRSVTLKPYPPSKKYSDMVITFTPKHRAYKLDKKILRITSRHMDKLHEILSEKNNKTEDSTLTNEKIEITQPVNDTTEQQKQHGGIERFALEREKVLAAALYVIHHYPKEVGKSFKSHAEAIENHGYKFWPYGEMPDTHRIAKMLSDATREPKDWKILGGRIKIKKHN
ncbi:TPA: hypothetical protein ACIBKF_003191 [Salmonella enterica subsp. enterica serovar 6,7:y:-]